VRTLRAAASLVKNPNQPYKQPETTLFPNCVRPKDRFSTLRAGAGFHPDFTPSRWFRKTSITDDSLSAREPASLGTEGVEKKTNSQRGVSLVFSIR
jgi:hypothetical protein